MKSKSTERKFFNSFPFRISLLFTIILSVVLIFSVLSMIFIVDLSVHRKQGIELERNCKGIIDNLSLQGRMNTDALLAIPYYITYSVYNSKTDYVYFTNDPLLPRNLKTTEKAKLYFEKNYFTDGDLKILYYSQNFRFPETSEPVTVISAIYLDADYATKLSDLFPYTFIPFVFVLITISFFISYLNTKRTIEPVVNMSRQVRKISSSELDTVLPVSSRNDELDELARTFNSLFIRIKKDFARERQFSSDVSHELKTPLAVISGQAKLLLRWGKDDKNQLEASLNSIANEAHSMQVIIENLLQISRYESGRLKPEFVRFNVFEFFERLQREFTHIDSEIPLEVLIDCDRNLEILSDSELLHQVFTAFMSNSIKFCDKDVCRITLRAIKQDEKILLFEEDNGRGFAKKDLPNVFNRFYTGDQARTRNVQKNSTGLGLAIAKTITSVLGGKIKASNSEEGGALITVKIPKSPKK